MEKEGGVKLTVKDRKILAELFEDGRESFSAVGKRVGLSKELVNYREKRLRDIGLLVGYNTVIDVKKLGWEMFFVYMRFRRIDIERERKIIGFLKEHDNVAQLFECMGNYDVVLKVFARDIEEANSIMKGIEKRFEENIEEYTIDLISEETAVPFSFLYETESKKLYYIERGRAEKIELSETEMKMLKALAKDARISLADMGEKLRISRDILKYHLKKLESEKVILKYRPDTLPIILGYNWYFLILKAGMLDNETKNALDHFLMNNPNVTYFYKTAGSSDIQVELRVKTNKELKEIIIRLRGILKTVLKRSELLTILHEHKYTYFPECLMGK